MNELQAINIVEAAIQSAETDIQLPESCLNLEGFTSPKIKQLLNTINLQVSTYLEVGLYKGATFISAIHENTHLKAVGIDNWSQFKGPKDEFFQAYNARSNGAWTKVLEVDCYSKEAIEEIKDIGTIDHFFFDGAHDAEAQKKAVALFKEVKSPVSILVVDDWKKWGKKPTNEAIAELGLNVIHQWELYDGYWEGIGITVFGT